MRTETKYNIGDEVLTDNGDKFFVKKICVYIYPSHINGEVKHSISYRLAKGDILSLQGSEDIFRFEEELSPFRAGHKE